MFSGKGVLTVSDMCKSPNRANRRDTDGWGLARQDSNHHLANYQKSHYVWLS